SNIYAFGAALACTHHQDRKCQDDAIPDKIADGANRPIDLAGNPLVYFAFALASQRASESLYTPMNPEVARHAWSRVAWTSSAGA
ncbi:MAG: hypothetical protein ACOX5J_03485, partial [Candidatus Hydrogenedentales bacterium]